MGRENTLYKSHQMAKKISGEAFEKKLATKKRADEIKSLIKDLKASDEVIVLDAIEKVKHLGDPRMIPTLVELLIAADTSQKVKDAVQNLLNQLKSPQVLPQLFACLEDPSTEGHRHRLIAAMWEAGLSPHEYLDDLTALAIDEDYLTCLEVLTVVENLTELPSEGALQENMQRLQGAIAFQPEKKDLLESLIRVLQDFLMS